MGMTGANWGYTIEEQKGPSSQLLFFYESDSLNRNLRFSGMDWHPLDFVLYIPSSNSHH